jgi:clan AA aspartic protease
VGTFNVTIEIGDPQGQRFEEVEALVDTGATLTSAPASLLKRLGVTPLRRGVFRLADGHRVEMERGETRVRVEGLETSTWLLFGEEGAPSLLGALTLEGLLLGVDPFNRRLVPVEGLLMSKSNLL